MVYREEKGGEMNLRMNYSRGVDYRAYTDPLATGLHFFSNPLDGGRVNTHKLNSEEKAYRLTFFV